MIIKILNRFNCFILSVSFIILSTHTPSYSFASSDNNPTKILFLGNSFTGWNEMPNMVKSYGDSTNVEIYVDTYLLYGRSLYEISIAAALETKIKSKDWDFIVMQDSPYRIAYPDDFANSNPLYPAIQRIKHLALLNNESTKFVFFLPWAYEDGQYWVEPDGDDYFEMQRKVIENTIEIGEIFELLIAPVGFAWNALIYSGNEIKLFEDDLTHPTVEGSYLAASVIFSTIFNLPVTNNSYSAEISSENASYMQNIATESVFNSSFNWDFITDIEHVENIKHEIFLQNYPNPFNPATTIKYTIPSNMKRQTSNGKTLIRLDVFNILGREVAILVNDRKAPGNHSVIFDAEGLPSGVYFCRLITNSTVKIQKMILLR